MHKAWARSSLHTNLAYLTLLPLTISSFLLQSSQLLSLTDTAALLQEHISTMYLIALPTPACEPESYVRHSCSSCACCRA